MITNKNRDNTVVVSAQLPVTYSQKIVNSARQAFVDTATGVVFGATVASIPGSYVAYSYHLDVQRGHAVTAEIRDGQTPSSDPRYMILALSGSDSMALPMLAGTLVVGAVVGGAGGALLGIARIFKTILSG